MLNCLISTGVIDDGVNGVSAVLPLLTIKLLLSQLSSSFGMAKFLQLGPCQLIPQNKMGIGMFLITVANFLGLWWKVGVIIGALDTYIHVTNHYNGLDYIGTTLEFFELFWRSCCIVVLPGLILVTFKKFIYIKSF